MRIACVTSSSFFCAKSSNHQRIAREESGESGICEYPWYRFLCLYWRRAKTKSPYWKTIFVTWISRLAHTYWRNTGTQATQRHFTTKTVVNNPVSTWRCSSTRVNWARPSLVFIFFFLHKIAKAINSGRSTGRWITNEDERKKNIFCSRLARALGRWIDDYTQK